MASSGDDVQACILIYLYGTLRVLHRHDGVFVTLHDEHWTLILTNALEHIDIAHLGEEAATHRHIPQACGVGDIAQVGIAGCPVVGDAQCGEDEYGVADILGHTCRCECRYESALALADEHDTTGIHVGLLLEIAHDGFEVCSSRIDMFIGLLSLRLLTDPQAKSKVYT